MREVRNDKRPRHRTPVVGFPRVRVEDVEATPEELRAMKEALRLLAKWLMESMKKDGKVRRVA